jgi:hypothetical protein
MRERRRRRAVDSSRNSVGTEVFFWEGGGYPKAMLNQKMLNVISILNNNAHRQTF